MYTHVLSSNQDHTDGIISLYPRNENSRERKRVAEEKDRERRRRVVKVITHLCTYLGSLLIRFLGKEAVTGPKENKKR